VKYSDENVLVFHMPSGVPAVKKYLRDYALESEYSILAQSDYVDNYGDRAAEAGSYPLATSHKVKGLSEGSKAVLIDVDRAQEALGSSFSVASFTADDGADEEERSEDDIEQRAQPLGDIDPEAQAGEYISVTVESEMDVKASGLSDGNHPVLKAHAHDETGEADLVSWDEHTEADSPGQPLSPWPELENDGLTPVYLEKVRVDEYEGKLQLVLERGKSSVLEIQSGVGHTERPSPEDADQTGLDTAADGGTTGVDTTSAGSGEPVMPKGKAKKAILTLLNQETRSLERMKVVQQVAEETDDDVTPELVKTALDDLQEAGEVIRNPDGKITRN
jgi:hypothetical protein